MGLLGKPTILGTPPHFLDLFGENSPIPYLCPEKTPQKPAIFLAGSPRASEKTLWWAAQAVTPKQWGIHRILAVRKIKTKGEFEVNDFLSLVVSNCFFCKIFHTYLGRWSNLDDFWPSWIYDPHGSMDLVIFFWCHRSTESHQSNTSGASGNIGWRHLLFQIDDTNLNVPSKQAQLGIPIV